MFFIIPLLANKLPLAGPFLGTFQAVHLKCSKKQPTISNTNKQYNSNPNTIFILQFGPPIWNDQLHTFVEYSQENHFHWSIHWHGFHATFDCELKLSNLKQMFSFRRFWAILRRNCEFCVSQFRMEILVFCFPLPMPPPLFPQAFLPTSPISPSFLRKYVLEIVI